MIDEIQPKCSGTSDGELRLHVKNVSTPLIQWSNGDIGVRASRLKAGVYHYIITSANGCTLFGSATLMGPPALQTVPVVVNPMCFGNCDGKIALEVSGGTTPYFVSWLNGARGTSIRNLCQGDYYYSIRDANNCAFEGVVEIVSPEQIDLVAEIKNPNCWKSADGEIKILTTGGVGPFQFAWFDGAHNANRVGLSAGNYSVTVTDGNHCTTIERVTLIQPSLLTMQYLKRDPRCATSHDGVIDVKPSGGTSPYSIQWNNEASSTMFLRTSLAHGAYEVKVSDSKNCIVSKNINLSSPPPIVISNISVQEPHCHGEQNGAITVNVVGGVAPYIFKWNDVVGGSILENLRPDRYRLVVVDANYCNTSADINVEEPVGPVISGIPLHTMICHGGIVRIEPGEIWKTYSWRGPSGFSSTSNAVSLDIPGSYHLRTTDNRDCPADLDFIIEESASPIAADFLILSEAVVFEPIVFVEVTWPKPTSIEWVFPQDRDVIVSKKQGSMVELIFTRADDFEVGLIARMNSCASMIYKTFTITDDHAANTDGRVNVEDKRFPQIEIFPNPVEDEMSIQITAPSPDRIDLKLLPVSASNVLRVERVEGMLDYLLHWDLSDLQPGVYTLFYTFGETMGSKKIVVIK